MQAFRSALFNGLFYLNLVLFMLIFAPLLLAPRPAAIWSLKLWSMASIRLLAVIAGTRFEVRGREHIPKGAALIASKHQSLFETFAVLPLLDDPAMVMKRELMLIPLFGWFARKFEMIPVDRGAGAGGAQTPHRPRPRGGGARTPGPDFPRRHAPAPGRPSRLQARRHRPLPEPWRSLRAPRPQLGCVLAAAQIHALSRHHPHGIPPRHPRRPAEGGLRQTVAAGDREQDGRAPGISTLSLDRIICILVQTKNSLPPPLPEDVMKSPALDHLQPIAQDIWEMKYRLKDPTGAPIDETVEDTWRRVATALAAPEEASKRDRLAQEFYEALEDHKFLPAGRILAGAGTSRRVTLFNCFVMGRIEDSMDGIFEGLQEAALTLQQGGGIGHDFSSLRPRGAPVLGVGADASGPLSFMDVWDAMCRTIMSAGSRRGAMMATMRCDHPDIEEFIAAKHDPARLRMFNLSVLVTDRFMEAVREDEDWPLAFAGRVYRVVKARELWDRILRSTYASAEPGVIFIDRINALNNLSYCETIEATNPCGEQPLPPYGACLLGSVNLTRFIRKPFTLDAALDLEALRKTVASAVRMLDNAIDISNYPLEAQKREAHAKRRIGLGLTGLADGLAMTGLRYGSPDAVARAKSWMAADRDGGL